ncbi:LLM class flavin-dependent oxidoreductase [Actinoplanes sp. TBRC 11911]|uniref:MupA/Atu3671 family FMN-dependent luciferase-like monooxygenase n=1 Tax=Actinoplanes sp. TBRC 11911 TaxID=2729386 RepID=UPI00145CEFBE|nr:MupA/Atu3671 family FMN-dependent luciferase-like monooxygenase [Actinoplanes sp. TBRC 11911]NMO57723.1 LLM class flavin-dependent oxidoreductase [Actinoplanes sp. TBRC 11911]
MRLSLFYFADDTTATEPGYRLLLEGARLADRAGLEAVWTPERHFHGFGGGYPNPSVTGAAVAAVTERIGIRAGSVAAPLHHLVRLAEEWAVVDNLSRGRAGISLAPGGSPADFVLNPQAYGERKRIALDTVEQLRRLWRGEPYRTDVMEPAGSYQVLPRPAGEIPLWLTTTGDPSVFRAAGVSATGVLTHLMRQRLPQLKEQVKIYREQLAAGGSTWHGHVTLMVHTYVDETAELAVARARPSLTRYLMSAMDFLRPEGAGSPTREAATRLAVRSAADRYLGPDGLVGSVDSLLPALDRFHDAGVDELACLIDFGLEPDAVLECVTRLGQLNTRWERRDFKTLGR